MVLDTGIICMKTGSDMRSALGSVVPPVQTKISKYHSIQKIEKSCRDLQV